MRKICIVVHSELQEKEKLILKNKEERNIFFICLQNQF